MDRARHHVGVGEHVARERRGGLHALDPQVAERAAQALQRVLAVLAAGDHLREQRVVVGRDRPAGEAGGVHAHVAAHGRRPALQPTGGGREAALGALGVDPRLDRVAAHLHLVLRHRQRRAARDAQLLAHHVHAGDHLADRVLHLQPRVDLEEGVAAPLLVDEELAGGRAVVGERADQRGRGAEDLALERLREAERGRLLDQLLVAALERAVAVAEVDHAAVLIGQHLNLHVAGAAHEALDEEAAVAERLLRLAAG